MTKTRKIRKAPIESATSLPEGTMKEDWVIKKASNGIQRWMPKTSVELNGFRLLTVEYAAKMVGKPIILYCRGYTDMWPKRTAWSVPEDPTYTKLKFVPNGDALNGKTIQKQKRLEGWLKSRTPAVKKGMFFSLDGPVYMCKNNKESKCVEYIANGMQVDSTNGKIVSDNLMNTETFIKV